MKERRTPYAIIQSRYMTEKTTMLGNLKDRSHNPSLKRCVSPKYVFLVDKRANKIEIARALEAIYAEKKIKVTGVNTLNVKRKKRRVKGRRGFRSGFKKAIVTLEEGDVIDENL